MLVLALDQDTYGNDIASALLVSGPVDGVVPATDARATFAGQSVDDLWVQSARFVGDVDGDGQGDILVGAGGSLLSDPGGVTSLFYGPFSGTRELMGADVRMLGEQMGAQAGHAIDGAGDVDGDGLDDLVIGSPGWSSTDGEGAAYVILGAWL